MDIWKTGINIDIIVFVNSQQFLPKHLRKPKKNLVDYVQIQFFRENGAECVCNDGFVLSPKNNNICEDLDECAENPFVCLHGRCLNTEGIII